MNKVLSTVLEPGDNVTVQESSGTGKQYKAVPESNKLIRRRSNGDVNRF